MVLVQSAEMRRTIPGFLVAVVGVLVASGCEGEDDPCRTVCERSATCDPGAPPVESCVALCEQESDADADYAEAIQAKADCLGDGAVACSTLVECEE